MYSVNLKKDRVSLLRLSGYEGRQRIYTSNLCGSLVIKTIKRSVINIQHSMLEVRCSTFKAFSPPLEDSLFRLGGISYEVSYERFRAKEKTDIGYLKSS